MGSPMNVLEPNYIGDSFKNLGVESLVENRGLGVLEANPRAMAARMAEGPGAARDKLRTAKAREFGKTKETVGF